MAQNTELGWILSERTGFQGNEQYCFQIRIGRNDMTEEINNRIKEMWEIEEFQPQQFITPDELKCEELFKEQTEILPNGKYMVHLPFRMDPPSEDF